MSLTWVRTNDLVYRVDSFRQSNNQRLRTMPRLSEICINRARHRDEIPPDLCHQPDLFGGGGIETEPLSRTKRTQPKLRPLFHVLQNVYEATAVGAACCSSASSLVPISAAAWAKTR